MYADGVIFFVYIVYIDDDYHDDDDDNRKTAKAIADAVWSYFRRAMVFQKFCFFRY